MIKKFFSTALLGLACLTCFAGTTNAQQVNGRNVEMVVYAKDGKVSGTIAQTGPKTWVEINGNGSFTFEEINRDDWSVYIRKTGRQAGQTLQVDLHRKTVSNFNNGTVGFKFYDVAASFSSKAKNPLVKFAGATPNPSVVNGRNVCLAIYMSRGCIAGAMVQTGPNKWLEYNNDGKFEFRENQRDEWSVYLTKSDGLNLQIDLHTKSVKNRNTGSKFYDIIKAAAGT